MKRFAATLALLLTLVGLAAAQDLTAQEVLANVKAEAESISDASFLLTGRLVDPDGTSIALEVEVEVIPKEEAGRATFIQPDALADNVVVLQGDTIYNYIFLTNQVTLFDANDPDALGGFLGGGGDDGNVELTLDLDALFSGWEPSIEGHEDNAYLLRLDNLDEAAAIDFVIARVQEDGWLPTELRLVDAGGKPIAELFVGDFRRDQGLSAQDVTYIPEDAEVIDERN